jgi:hypothetical protein
MRGSKPRFDTPDPELLAAYLDGEFEGRDGLDDLRQRIEGWLESDPAAHDLVRDYRRLRRAWTATTPREPGRNVWKRLLSGVEERRESTSPTRARRRWALPVAAGCAAALLVALGWTYIFPPAAARVAQTPVLRAAPSSVAVVPEDDFVLPVARAEEITIIAGGDDVTIGVSQLHRPFELASAEEVTIDTMGPSKQDGAVPTVRFGARSPMIWSIASKE